MSPEQQRKAELDAIDRKRREKEALLLALLLGFYGYGRNVVSASIRSGHAPLPALDRAFLGNGTAHFPGVAGKLANGLASIHLEAQATEAKAAPQPTKPTPPEPSTPTPGARKGLEPSSQTAKTPDAPESQPAGIDATVGESHPPTVGISHLPTPVMDKSVVARSYKPFADRTVEEMRQNVSALVDDVMTHAKDAGASINAIITTMREAFVARGWTTTNPARAKAQAITLAASAWSAGSFAGWRQPGVWEKVTGFQFVTVADERVCPVCHPRNGIKLPRDHPWWLSNTAPLHMQCRCLTKALFKPFDASTLPANLLPAQAGFGNIPSLSPGYSALGTL